MTKDNIQKIMKKRAGLNKQKKLQDKKKFLKKHQLWSIKTNQLYVNIFIKCIYLFFSFFKLLLWLN